MKKLISFILVLTVLFNVVSFSVYAEEQFKFTDEQKTLLTAIGLYNNDLILSETLTRAEFANMLVKSFFDEPQYLIEGTENFNDVTSEHDYYHSIMLLKNLKVSYGDGSGNFEPDELILANDAIVMAVRFLGYTKLAEKTGYIPFAAQKGISKGVKYSYNEELSVYNALMLIYNILTVDVSDKYVDDTASFMRAYRTLHKVEGVVDDDSFISKDGLSSIGKDEIIIDGVIYKNATGEKNLFGCDVIGFYKFIDDEATIISLIKTDNNNTLIIDSRNIEKYDPITRTYTYRESEFDDFTEEVSVPSDVTVVYNGVPLTIADTQFTNETFIPSTGTVTLFDGNGDKRYEYLYINSYETYVAATADVTNNIIYTKEFEKPIELKKDEYTILDDTGFELELSAITDGSIISVMKSFTGDIVKIYVSKSSVTDIIVAKEDDGLITTQSGSVFKLSEHFMNKAYENSLSIPKGTKIEEALKTIDFSCLYKIYLDVFGDVAYIEPAETNLWSTAVVIKAGNDSRSSLADNYIIELYDFSGQYIKYSLSEKVVFSDENNVSDRYSDAKAVELLNAFAGSETNKNRVVRYKLNLKGKITEIELPLRYDFPREEINTDRLFILADSSKGTLTYNSSGMFVGKFVIAGETKVLLMPESKTNNYEKYAFLAPSNTFVHDKSEDTLIAYGTDTKNMEATNLIKTVSDDISFQATSDGYFAVTKITEEFDYEEMISRTKLIGFKGKTEASIYVENKAIVNEAKVFGTDKTVKVSVGDIIVYSTDKTVQDKVLVNGISVLYDADGVLASTGKGFFGENKGVIPGAKVDSVLATSATEYGNPVGTRIESGMWAVAPASHTQAQVSPCRIAIGFVYAVNGENVILTTQPINSVKYSSAANATGKYVTEIYSRASNKVLKMKKLSDGEVKISTGSVADLKPYTVYGNACSMVVYLGYWGVDFIYVLE